LFHLPAFRPLPQLHLGLGSWLDASRAAGTPLSPGHGTQARAPPPEWAALRHRFSAQLGVGRFTPHGRGAVTYGFAPVQWLRLDALLGHDFPGLQLSFVPTFVLGTRRHRLFASPGIAWHTRHCLMEAGVPLLGNADAGYEHVFPNGFSLFLAVGASGPLRRYPGLEGRVIIEGLPRGGMGWWF
jgi:hypothetical protein